MRPLLLILATFLVHCALADDPTATCGDYSVALTRSGLAISHRGEQLTLGSYLNVFKPKYEGTLLSSGGLLDGGRAQLTEDGRTVYASAELSAGVLTYSATVTEQGATITLRGTVNEGLEVGPVEYAVLQFAPGVVQGTVLEMRDDLGDLTETKPVPEVGVRGGMTGRGLQMAIKSSDRTIRVVSHSTMGIYAFDARVPNYGDRQGIWAFSSPGFQPGRETLTVVSLRVDPPEPPQPEGTITLASGEPVTGIALAPEPTRRERLAADELAKYLQAICGRRLEVVETAAAEAPEGSLLVGPIAVACGAISRAELDALQRDGYVVRVTGGRAAICGWRDLGTVYGAYALLKALGVKFYAPDCEAVPHQSELVIPELALQASPHYEFRHLSGNMKLGQTPGDDCMAPSAIGESGNIVHSSDYLLPFDKYGEEHPEYFALQKDGKRLHRGAEGESFNVHLCLSNPDVRRISAERMIALMDIQQDRTFFGVSQGDGFAWCQCDRCKALDAVPGVEMTDRLLDYVNAVARECAKTHPEKKILTLAYTNATSPPPTRVLPEPNVMVQYCPYPNRTACHSHDLFCEKNTQALADLMGWVKKCPQNMYIFDYPCGYQNWYEPFGGFWAMKHKMDLYAVSGIKGLYYCGTPANFRNLFIFVQSRLLWEPRADVEALIDEFIPAYYGAAAPLVREYFDYLHHEIDTRPVHQMCEAANPGLVTPEFAEKALDILSRAEAAVVDDKRLLRRVQREKMSVLFADLSERNPVNDKLAVGEDEFARRLGQFLDIGRTWRIDQFVRGTSTNQWLYRIARVREDHRTWYAGETVRRLIEDPAETLQSQRELGSQDEIPGGVSLRLEGFLGCRGPEVYSHDCAAKRAVWIYGTGSATPFMRVGFNVKQAPPKARLVLLAQDDDKPGAVPIRISINGQTVFEGANPFVERGWSEAEYQVPTGVIKAGLNEFRIETLQPSAAPDAGWFMLAEAKVMFGE